MFKDTVTFQSFSANDLQEAEKFYSETLGIKTEKQGYILRLHLAGSTPVAVYGKPNHVPASFTILNFQVKDVEATVDALIAKGITFEQYTGDIQTDEKGIFRGNGPTIAWFKDPAGNILSVIESSPAQD